MQRNKMSLLGNHDYLASHLIFVGTTGHLTQKLDISSPYSIFSIKWLFLRMFLTLKTLLNEGTNKMKRKGNTSAQHVVLPNYR
jgi:hypothetical protein